MSSDDAFAHGPEADRLAAVALPPTFSARNPLSWCMVFGPGAIIASLTIGTGELIFSSRAGAIFGYRILFLFTLILVLKWALVFAMARHMVLTGVHPLQRWFDLPFGPRGWFPALLLLLATACIPVWVSFHSGVIGNLISGVTGTRGLWNGADELLWGGLVLAGVAVLAMSGGYRTLERIQLWTVAAMLLSACAALILYKPDWVELAISFVVPRPLEYPAWLESEYPEIAGTPLWVELTRYVGVIGGASYDYLAYVSFLRDKRWGLAGVAEADPADLDRIARSPHHAVRSWVRAPLVDCTLSFLVVLAFSAVFVASGTLVLGPSQQIPTDGAFLEHQAKFVTNLHPWLLPLYLLGAFLAMFGTLYGTLEVAPTLLRETLRSLYPPLAVEHARRIRWIALLWCAAGAGAILLATAIGRLRGIDSIPASLTAVLTPANLFTGVLSCGLICLLNPWTDRRFLPKPLRMSRFLLGLNVTAGVVFLALGLKGYWEHSHWFAIGALAGTVAIGWIAASLLPAASAYAAGSSARKSVTMRSSFTRGAPAVRSSADRSAGD